MKRRYIAILIISLTTWLYACETEMMGYEGESSIYFMMQKPPGMVIRSSMNTWIPL